MTLVPIPTSVLTTLAFVVLAGLIGVVLHVWRAFMKTQRPEWQRFIAFTMVWAVLDILFHFVWQLAPFWR